MLNQDKAFNRLVGYIRQNGEEVEVDSKEQALYNTVSIVKLDDLYAISDRDGWRDVVTQCNGSAGMTEAGNKLLMDIAEGKSNEPMPSHLG